MNFIKFDKFSDLDFEKIFESYEETDMKNKIFATSYDLREVNAIKKNSKIAGVNKDIEFAKKEIEYLDQKFEENEIDLIVSYVPNLSKKIMNEFCHQAEFIAKKVVLLTDVEFSCNEKYFNIEKEKILRIGESNKKIVWLRKINQ